jgi:hypothetical protein
MTAYSQIPIPEPPAIKSLPLSLTSFTAQLLNKKVLLSWVTDMELNTSHFTIQRSFNGNTYDDVGMVFTGEQARSHNKYDFTDNIGVINARMLYYRLKWVDLDGRYSYSEIVQIRLISPEESVSVAVYPNPATDQLRVTIPESWQNKTIYYIIYNMEGILIRQKISANAGQTETLPVGDLPEGIYIIRTANGNQAAVQKFIKAK